MHFASSYRWLVYQHLFGLPPGTRSTATILDIGCDDGGFVERLPARLSVALDRSLQGLRQTRAHVRVCADGTRMPFQSVQFSHVLLSDVIEHVVDDGALVRGATACVQPGGLLWLSTTASQFQLFPASITRRAEQSWGHVRKGYTPAQLVALLGAAFDCTVVEWAELTLRHSYALLWACSRRMPALACRLAAGCFALDCRLEASGRLTQTQHQQGHIYMQATRRRDVPAHSEQP